MSTLAPGRQRSRVWAALRGADTAVELTFLGWLVPLALLHGLIYLVIFPPWQHYDEPTHFLYAAGIAAGELEAPGPASDTLQRAIAESMYRARFFPPGERPDTSGPVPPAIGSDQRLHPPLYYTIAALPIRLLADQPVEQQLYGARGVSLLFYGLTIVVAWRIAVAMAPGEPFTQLLIPLLVLLTPAFSDIMTAVNNDVLLNFSLAVATLGAVLLIRDGPRPVAMTLVLLGLVVGFMTKRTALVAIVPLGMACLWSVWRRPMRWWGLPLLAALATVIGGIATLQPVIVDGPAGPHTILSVRPWFAALDERYLRMYLDLTVRSITDPALIGGRYQFMTMVAFSGYYTHFAWGGVTMHTAWVWAMAALSLAATVGLVVGGLRTRESLPLWQRRCLWLFLIAVVAAWLSLFIRVHPLPPIDNPRFYIPRGRYMFWALVPNLWLLAVGLAWLTPRLWRRRVLYALVAFFLCLDLAAWMLTIVQHYYA